MSDSQPKLFVVVTVHDAYRYIDKCMTSIVAQDYPNFEVLIADDNSTDGTWDKARLWAAGDSRVRAKRTAEHNGASTPTLIEMLGREQLSPATIVAIVGGDDYLPVPTVFSRVVARYTGGAWMTYGTYVVDSEGKFFISKPACASPTPELLNRVDGMRELFFQNDKGLPFGPLQTFYYGLYQKLPKPYLIDPQSGRIWHTGGDTPLMTSLAELARDRAQMMPDPIYVYNWDNPKRVTYRYGPALARERFERFCSTYKPLEGLKCLKI